MFACFCNARIIATKFNEKATKKRLKKRKFCDILMVGDHTRHLSYMISIGQAGCSGGSPRGETPSPAPDAFLHELTCLPDGRPRAVA